MVGWIGVVDMEIRQCPEINHRQRERERVSATTADANI